MVTNSTGTAHYMVHGSVRVFNERTSHSQRRQNMEHHITSHRKKKKEKKKTNRTLLNLCAKHPRKPVCSPPSLHPPPPSIQSQIDLCRAMRSLPLLFLLALAASASLCQGYSLGDLLSHRSRERHRKRLILGRSYDRDARPPGVEDLGTGQWGQNYLGRFLNYYEMVVPVWSNSNKIRITRLWLPSCK